MSKVDRGACPERSGMGRSMPGLRGFAADYFAIERRSARSTSCFHAPDFISAGMNKPGHASFNSAGQAWQRMLSSLSRLKPTAMVNVALFLITLVFTLRIPVDFAGLNTFPDSADYLRQSGMSVASAEFYAPHSAPGFYPRPFMVPLFYKLAGGNPHGIVFLQEVIHAVAALFLASSLALLMTSEAAKCLIIVTVY